MILFTLRLYIATWIHDAYCRPHFGSSPLSLILSAKRSAIFLQAVFAASRLGGRKTASRVLGGRKAMVGLAGPTGPRGPWAPQGPGALGRHGPHWPIRPIGPMALCRALRALHTSFVCLSVGGSAANTSSEMVPGFRPSKST